jgi:hypothetical protein
MLNLVLHSPVNQPFLVTAQQLLYLVCRSTFCSCRNKAIVIRESHNRGDRPNHVTKLSLGETR